MSRRVLLVDDEPYVTKSLMRSLRQEPYEILTSGSADEALGILATESVDIIISDERMPGMSGSELLARVRKQYPDIVRILLTGHASLKTAISAINEGEIYRFFTKPWNPIDLAITIRQALRQKELEEENSLLLKKVKSQSKTLKSQSEILKMLEEEHPGITSVKKDPSGAVFLDEQDIDEAENYTLDLIFEETD